MAACKVRRRADDGDNGVAVAEMPSSEIPSAVEAIERLKTSGTPREKLRLFDEWLRTNEAASAEALYQHAQDVPGINSGTIRKLCKIVNGPDSEPESAMAATPADEMARVRRENDRLSDRVGQLEAEKLTLLGRVRILEDQKSDLAKQVQYLRIGRSSEELAALDAAK